MLKALEVCRPTACGVLPLPTLGVKPVQKVKLHREMKLPPWMHQHLGENEAPGIHGGQALGHAKRLEESKQEKVPQQLSSKEMPKSVEDAEALIRSTFGASACGPLTSHAAEAMANQWHFHVFRGVEVFRRPTSCN